MKMSSLLVAASLVLISSTQVLAQTAPCQVPPNFNPYTDVAPDSCRNDGFVPYQVAAGEFAPAAFIFAGGVVNAETLAYLDLTNGSSYAQRVDVEIQLVDKTVLRTFVLPPKPTRPSLSQDPSAAPFASINLSEDPALRGLALSFAVQVTFERLGSATLTMRPAAAPWSSAITVTPHIVDLPKPVHD